MALVQSEHFTSAKQKETVSLTANANGIIVMPIATYGMIINASVTIGTATYTALLRLDPSTDRYFISYYFNGSAWIAFTANTTYSVSYISVNKDLI